MTERTFSIIKPDATKRNLTGKVNAVIEDAGLRIVAQRRIQMSQAQAEKFYEVHKERPFFGELVEFMTSAPVVVQVPDAGKVAGRPSVPCWTPALLGHDQVPENPPSWATPSRSTTTLFKASCPKTRSIMLLMVVWPTPWRGAATTVCGPGVAPHR